MKIYSWNLNGIRAATKKGLPAWLDQTDASIVALQEVRATQRQIPAEIRGLSEWHLNINPAEKPGYSGVGLLARTPWDHIEHATGVDEFDNEGRLQFATFGALKIVNGYFPNGSGRDRDNSRVPYKLRFYQHLFDSLEAARANGEPILVVGDFNTAHQPIDLARPKSNEKTSGFLPEERAELGRWLDYGWTDTFRALHPESVKYTWWSQRRGVREKNIGWRIDYILASPGAMRAVTSAEIHDDVLGSDHCPISVTLDPARLGNAA